MRNPATSWVSTLDSMLPENERTGVYHIDAQRVLGNRNPILAASKEFITAMENGELKNGDPNADPMAVAAGSFRTYGPKRHSPTTSRPRRPSMILNSSTPLQESPSPRTSH